MKVKSNQIYPSLVCTETICIELSFNLYRIEFIDASKTCIETTLYQNDRSPHTNFDLAFTSRFLNFKMTFSRSLSGFGAIATAIIPELKCLKIKHSLNMMHINVELGNC